MTLNASGPISLGGTTSGQSIELELGGGGTTQISLNDTNVRTLAGVPSGAITMPTNFYGKSNYSGPYWIVGSFDGKVYRSNDAYATSFNSGTQVGSGGIPNIWIRSSAVNLSTPIYAVGDGAGNVWSSTDALAWTQHALTSTTSSPTSQISAMGYANSLFLIGDYAGNFWYSSNNFSTITGSSSTISSNALFGSFVYGNLGGNNYYAVTDSSGNAIVSTNLSTWNTYATGSIGGVNSLCYGNGYLVVGSGQSQSARQIFYSSNGSSWSSVTLASAVSFNNVFVAYGNSHFVAVDATGAVYVTGTNPSTGWSNTAQLLAGGYSTGLVPRAITFANGIFLITGDNGYTWQSSNNGSTWSDGATVKLGTNSLYTSSY